MVDLDRDIGARPRGGAIGIVAARENGYLRLDVHDDGPGPTRGEDGGGGESTGRSGLGLANTRQRLEELYGKDAQLTLGASAGRS